MKNTFLNDIKMSAEKYAEKIAVSDQNGSITYKKLDNDSNGIANKLIDHGIKKGSRVGILGPRNFHFIKGILGILKTGSAYVPLDPAYPLERLMAMIEASEIDTLLYDSLSEAMATQLIQKGSLKQMIQIDDATEDCRVNPLIDISCDDSIVILFTSGSTGKPKGVELPYAGYLNNFKNMQALLKLDQETNIAQMASPCFDISVTELLMPLLFGSTIHIVSDETKKNPWLLAEWIQHHQIDTIQFVPSLFHHFLLAHEDDPFKLPCIKKLLFIGEALRSSHIKTWFKDFAGDDCRVFNLYGPVEASIEVSAYIVDSGTHLMTETVPIGKPFEGVGFHLLDEEGREILETGVEGMLCLSGVQLAKGYLNPEQTAKAFKMTPQGRHYETGDVATQLESGDYLFKGRKDRQIKIRGFRVEIVEIEEALAKCSGVKKAAVVVDKSNDGIIKLIGFVTGNIPSTDSVKGELEQKLPNFMIPHKLIAIHEMPLNSNGKTDYKALTTHVS